jgi:N6-adenosine-specific RNA methylase IME4
VSDCAVAAGTDDATLVIEALRLQAQGQGYRSIANSIGRSRHWVRHQLMQLKLKSSPTGAAVETISPAPINITDLEFHPLANLFPLIEGAAFDDLVADILANGQREDIVLLDGMVLDGRNRYRACLAAGITPRIVAFKRELHGEPLAFVVSKNLKRRHLNDDQRRFVAAKIANLGRGRPNENAADCGISRAEAARLVNVDEAGTERARTVIAKGTPALVRAVERGKLSVAQAAMAVRFAPASQQERIAAEAEAGRINAARTVIKQEARQSRERDLGAKIAAGNLALPEQKFGGIIADPAWGRTVYSRDTGMDRHAANHYATATGDEATQDDAIKALPVASLAAPDCVLGLWCTDPHRGVDVLRAWGFEPKSYFVWAKDIVEIDGDRNGCAMFKSGDRFEVVGAASMGFWRRDRCELMLLGVRGSPVCPALGTQGESIWFARRGEHAASREDSHSDKPDCAHEWFERHYPNTPKVELNARRARPGWHRWGAEANADNDSRKQK